MPRPSRLSCSRGLSLAEVLLVMALLLVVTALMAGLVRGYSDILRFAGGKSHTLEIAQAALGRIAAEITEAARLDLSTPEVLRLERLDPDPAIRAARLPAPGSQGITGAWRPFATDHLITVTYQRSAGDLLIRQAGGQSVEVADNITGLSCSSNGESVQLVLSTLEGGRTLRALSTHIYLPASLAP